MIIIIISTLIAAAVVYSYHSYTSCDKLSRQLQQERKNVQSMQLILKEQQENQQKIELALHDKLGANLSALHLHINIIKKDIPEPKFNTIRNILIESIQETRKMSNKTYATEQIVVEKIPS